MILSILIAGVAVGSVYAMIGICYNVMYSTSKVLSFTSGQPRRPTAPDPPGSVPIGQGRPPALRGREGRRLGDTRGREGGPLNAAGAKRTGPAQRAP